jgi:AhpD family alkylhydroperoxidase
MDKQLPPRIDLRRVSLGIRKAMLSLDREVSTRVEPHLLTLIKLRASQVNGCAYCIDIHWKDARALGESEERLYMLDAWRESSLYSDAERAALAWTEAITQVSETNAPDADFAMLRAHFSEEQAADITWAVGAINLWNRVAIGVRSTPGIYRAQKASAADHKTGDDLH